MFLNHLKWRFFFLDVDKEKFLKLYQELKGYDYTIERFEFQNDLWKLVVVKTETLAPEKLHRRNIAFNELVNYCNVYRYDGWEASELKE